MSIFHSVVNLHAHLDMNRTYCYYYTITKVHGSMYECTISSQQLNTYLYIVVCTYLYLKEIDLIILIRMWLHFSQYFGIKFSEIAVLHF